MIFWDKLKSLTVLYERLTEDVKNEYHLTQLEFDILMFLYNNPQYKTASDIVRAKRLTKSHVSASVASLKKKGLLKGNYLAGNQKNIYLTLTPATSEIISAGKIAQAEYGDVLARGFSGTEKNEIKDLFLRLCENADRELNRRIS